MKPRPGEAPYNAPGVRTVAVLAAVPMIVALLLAVGSVADPVGAAHPGAAPTAVVTATITPAPNATAGDVDECVACQPPALTPTTDLNVRSGPGVDYAVLGYLRAGQSADIRGISADAAWLQIAYAAAPDGTGWVARRYVELVGDLSVVPVVAVVAVPTPSPSPTPTPTATPTPAPTDADAVSPVAEVVAGWQGEYFDGLQPQGSPRLVRIDPTLDFNWADRAPAPGMPVDDFSVRWTRTVDFRDSTYHFTVEADDGVRLWIDDRLTIDEWHDTRPSTYAADVEMSEGPHRLRLEYYEHLANAMVRLTWRRPEAWKARYFGNTKLKDDPLLERWEEEINYDWGSGAPDPVVPADNFSARWTSQATFHGDIYVFTVEVDDGVRLWVDDDLLIDSWQEGTRTLRAERRFGARAERTVRVEYYERWGNAHIRVWWERK